MKLYKLTNQTMQTRNSFQWRLCETKTTSGRGELCSSGWLHAYSHPLIAILHNPVHANFPFPRMFLCEGVGSYKDDRGLKCGISSLTLIQEIKIPEITTEQRVEYAIRCALVNCTDSFFANWANSWLNGTDRSSEAAARAARAAARAARAAARAAWAAAWAARAAAWAAWAAAEAARAAAWAAWAAPLNLIEIAQLVCPNYIEENI